MWHDGAGKRDGIELSGCGQPIGSERRVTVRKREAKNGKGKSVKEWLRGRKETAWNLRLGKGPDEGHDYRMRGTDTKEKTKKVGVWEKRESDRKDRSKLR